MDNKNNLKHIDDSIINAMHTLELKSVHNFKLIGSNSLTSILYANDYDLNSNINVQKLESVYKQFLNLFDKCYKNKLYYITDFKNGNHDGDTIRWTYKDMQTGFLKIDVIVYKFTDCLKQKNNKIKLDLVYLYNNILTDINMLYNIKGNHGNAHNIQQKFDDDIKKAESDKNYYKIIKRKYNKSLITDEGDPELLEIINSEYGLLYQVISCLKLIKVMIDQTFKPISVELIKINLQYIKNIANKINEIEIKDYLDEINDICKLKTIDEIDFDLTTMTAHLEYYFNSLLIKKFRYKIFNGGSVTLGISTLSDMLKNSYKNENKTINNYEYDSSLSKNKGQVYYNPSLDHLVVAHRGTSGIHDVVTDLKLMLGNKDNNRFEIGKNITDSALNKYNTNNVSIIGHSLGASVAKESNREHGHEYIGVNPAIVPTDLFEAQHDNEHIFRNKYDVVSILHDLNPKKNSEQTYTIETEDSPFDVLNNHTIDQSLPK